LVRWSAVLFQPVGLNRPGSGEGWVSFPERMTIMSAPSKVTIVERQAPCGKTSAGVDQFPDRAAALNRDGEVVDLVLAQPEPPLPRLHSIRPSSHVVDLRGDRPGSHRHLLGIVTANQRRSLGKRRSVVTGGFGE
jgi:hypothetical protein